MMQLVEMLFVPSIATRQQSHPHSETHQQQLQAPGIKRPPHQPKRTIIKEHSDTLLFD
jgi:hypothetical protein